MIKLAAMAHYGSNKNYCLEPRSDDPEPEPEVINSEVATDINKNTIHLINALDEEDPEQDGLTGTMAVPTDDFMSSTVGPKDSLISEGSVDGMDVGKIGLPI